MQLALAGALGLEEGRTKLLSRRKRGRRPRPGVRAKWELKAPKGGPSPGGWAGPSEVKRGAWVQRTQWGGQTHEGKGLEPKSFFKGGVGSEGTLWGKGLWEPMQKAREGVISMQKGQIKLTTDNL